MSLSPFQQNQVVTNHTFETAKLGTGIEQHGYPEAAEFFAQAARALERSAYARYKEVTERLPPAGRDVSFEEWEKQRREAETRQDPGLDRMLILARWLRAAAQRTAYDVARGHPPSVEEIASTWDRLLNDENEPLPSGGSTDVAREQLDDNTPYRGHNPTSSDKTRRGSSVWRRPLRMKPLQLAHSLCALAGLASGAAGIWSQNPAWIVVVTGFGFCVWLIDQVKDSPLVLDEGDDVASQEMDSEPFEDLAGRELLANEADEPRLAAAQVRAVGGEADEERGVDVPDEVEEAARLAGPAKKGEAEE